jgi:hypothetical protein
MRSLDALPANVSLLPKAIAILGTRRLLLVSPNGKRRRTSRERIDLDLELGGGAINSVNEAQ